MRLLPINPKPPVTIIFFINFNTIINILSILHSYMEFSSNNLNFVIFTFNSIKVIYSFFKFSNEKFFLEII